MNTYSYSAKLFAQFDDGFPELGEVSEQLNLYKEIRWTSINNKLELSDLK